jgi:aryl-alcohol dehydrogenase-like predicted oxidoreductase
MKPRFALLVAAVLTTFVLVLVGAIVSRLAQPSPAELAAAADVGIAAVPPVTPTLDVQATASARDALYQQQLAEAAERIAQANQQLEQAYGQPPAAAAPAWI